MAASAVFLPVQPLMVSAVHTGLMEVVICNSLQMVFLEYTHLVGLRLVIVVLVMFVEYIKFKTDLTLFSFMIWCML